MVERYSRRYSLNELASSGLLPWTNRETVLKLIKEYSDIFRPDIRGNGHGKRYEIWREDIDTFLKMFRGGTLRGYRRLGRSKRKILKERVYIVSADSTDRAKKIREEIEVFSFKTDILFTHSRREFMGILGSTVRTGAAIILVVKAKGNNISFPDGTSIGSTEIRRIRKPVGIAGKSILLWSESPSSTLIEEALKKRGSVSYQEINGVTTSKNIKAVLSWLEKVKKTGVHF